MDATLSALLVLVRTPHVRDYLEQNEPRMLEQALAAIEELEAVRLAGELSVSVFLNELNRRRGFDENAHATRLEGVAL